MPHSEEGDLRHTCNYKEEWAKISLYDLLNKEAKKKYNFRHASYEALREMEFFRMLFLLIQSSTSSQTITL
jgi:hypothetical protein